MAAIAASNSPSSLAFPSAHKPNPHPYAVKTTSTALLSRSNSSHNSQAPKTHYVPLSPGPSPTRPSQKAHGHRYSKSLSDESPSPLPIPVGANKLATASTSTPLYPAPLGRSKRADTLPSVRSETIVTLAPPLEDLPSNPKQWTPAQLSSYLITALRVRSGETMSLPLLVARDIANFVRERGMTGKAFLRATETDLEEIGINQLWRGALISSSRHLRQNVVRGRIWGLSSPLEEPEPHSSPGPSCRNAIAGSLYHSASSGSSLDLQSSPTNAYKHGRSGYRNGRVKGMVASLERSSSLSEGETDDTPWASRRRSVSAELPSDRRFRTASVSHSDGEASDDYPTYRPIFTAAPADIFTEAETVEHAAEDEPSMEVLLSSSQAGDAGGSWGARAWELELGPCVTVKRLVERNGQGDGAQPRAIGAQAWEELDSGVGVVTVKRVVSLDEGLAGAEEDTAAASRAAIHQLKPNLTGSGKGKGKGKPVEGWDTKGKAGRRIVTAIFAHGDEADNELADGEDNFSRSAGEHASQEAKEEIEISSLKNGPTSSGDDAVPVNAAEAHFEFEGPAADRGERGRVPHEADPTGSISVRAPEDLHAKVQRQFEAELRDTRELLDAFKKRLEVVEGKLEEMANEEEERRRKTCNVCETNKLASSQAQDVSRSETTAVTIPPLGPRTLFSRVLAYVRHTTASTSSSGAVNAIPLARPSDKTAQDTPAKALAPNQVHGIPTYVLLVGIGMCSVLLKVLLRRIGNRLKT